MKQGLEKKSYKKETKKTSDKFSESQKVYYFCTPPRREKRERVSGSKRKRFFRNRERKKEKISFGKVERFTTFADPNGRVLERAKEVRS